MMRFGAMYTYIERELVGDLDIFGAGGALLLYLLIPCLRLSRLVRTFRGFKKL